MLWEVDSEGLSTSSSWPRGLAQPQGVLELPSSHSSAVLVL